MPATNIKTSAPITRSADATNPKSKHSPKILSTGTWGALAGPHHGHVARPRTNTQFDQPAPSYEDGQPMWSILVRSDVTKQLAALEKIAREEETRIQQERKKRRHGRR